MYLKRRVTVFYFHFFNIFLNNHKKQLKYLKIWNEIFGLNDHLSFHIVFVLVLPCTYADS